eukprot:8599622-Prorocentrum_lima.AAC.1
MGSRPPCRTAKGQHHMSTAIGKWVLGNVSGNITPDVSPLKWLAMGDHQLGEVHCVEIVVSQSSRSKRVHK